MFVIESESGSRRTLEYSRQIKRKTHSRKVEKSSSVKPSARSIAGGKSLSTRELFGSHGSCFTLNAKHFGNIGRYFNVS